MESQTPRAQGEVVRLDDQEACLLEGCCCPLENGHLEAMRVEFDQIGPGEVAVVHLGVEGGHGHRDVRYLGEGRLAGLAAEFGVVMLIYLKNALQQRIDDGVEITPAIVAEAVREGALLRLRPKAMTVAVILAGLLPILWTGGAGAEVMRRIAAPLVGGMISAPLLSLFVIPAAYLLIRRRGAAVQKRADNQQRIALQAGETP